MSKPAYFVGPWDLNRDLACVPQDPEAGSVVLVESVAKGRSLPWHRKKLVLVLSAMRHFAEELRADGYDVDLRQAPTYAEGIAAHVAERGATRVIALQPREWGLQQSLAAADLGAPLELHPDGGEGGHFLLPREAFLAWAGKQKGPKLRMDVFYRWMRKRTGWLLDGEGKPVGGKWSFDADNRQTPPAGVSIPTLPSYAPDAITRAAMDQVGGWTGRWGSVDGFDWPVTRADALHLLDDFVTHRLEHFGAYQDALVTGEPFLWHSLLAVPLNLSLLSPEELCLAALDAYAAGKAPLNSVEGFVRQVLGWREFMRGVYWLRMPGLREANLLGADRPLPAAYWEPERTDMVCLREAAGAVRDHGYAHHIQRLMVLGNFALLAGVRPLELSHWFWAGFVDAYEWVQLPNVHGMALYADDLFTTKPYAASGSYIDRMSDHCGRCPYDVKARTGAKACPFNHLFWRFMAEHRERLSENPRVKVLYRSWDRWTDAQRAEILASAEAFLASLPAADHGWTFADDDV